MTHLKVPRTNSRLPSPCILQRRFAFAAYFPNLKVATIFFRELRDCNVSHPRIL